MARSLEAGIGKSRHVPWWGWLLRGIGCLFALLLIILAGLAIFYFAVVAPRERARQAEVERKAAAFARLSGPARQLAIYDGFVAAIDEHYFDRTFAGFDWPRLKREWRSKAAASRDEDDLYFGVFLPMSQAFPVSHVGPTVPERPRKSIGPSPAPPAFSSDDSGARLLEPIRRGKGMINLVGEVFPNSPAATAGLQPAALIETVQITPAGKGNGHVSAKLLCLTPAEAHLIEHGATKLSLPLAVHACQAVPARQMMVAYKFAYQGRPRPDIIVRRLPTGALYIRFDAFEYSILKKAVAALRAAGPLGVVIDLRFNHGGYVDPLLDALFPAFRPLYRRRDAGGLHTISTPTSDFQYLGQLVLLTGPSSVSAAEVTAAVVKSQHRGLIVGRATNGSVLGAGFFDLPDGGKVEVPVESIEMPDGSPLEGVGVMPDVEVYPTLAELRAGKDPALERAEAILVRTAAIRH